MSTDELIALGFTATTEPGKPRCHNCEALVINGVPCHETGCYYAMRECAGCSALVPANSQRFCQECRS